MWPNEQRGIKTVVAVMLMTAEYSRDHIKPKQVNLMRSGCYLRLLGVKSSQLGKTESSQKVPQTHQQKKGFPDSFFKNGPRPVR